MITLQDFSLYLDNLFSKEEWSDYCPNGLQVEGKREIKKIAFAVSASLAAIETAAALGADALLVHHGIFWTKDSLPVVGVKKKKLHSLLVHEVSLFAYHLPLDAHREVGNNWKAAQDLGVQNRRPFGGVGKQYIGVVGEMPSLGKEEVQKKLETYYRHVAHTAWGDKPLISTIAIVSGGGHRYIEEAAKEGIDCFVTGSFDEPIWDMAKELNVHFFALGHHATERVGVLALKKKVELELGVECVWIEQDNLF